MALLLVVFFFLLASSTSAELTIPVNKTCSTLTLQSPSTRTLDLFFTEIVAASNSNMIHQEIITATPTSVIGDYRCSANISQTECKTCLELLIGIIPRSCDTATVKLEDCYMGYQLSKTQVVDYGDGGENDGGCLGALVASVVGIVLSILLQS